ncbi:Outer envelope protein 64 chloroplastic [Bienertia sinuspersici]
MASSSANLWVMLGLGLAGILLMTKKFKKSVKEDFGAFIHKLQLLPPPQPAPPKAPNPLTGLTFAVSDLIDIEGHVTGFGNPDWARTHEAASKTAPVVSILVDGGATCVGKTIIDDMACSVSGENKHYGTPTNPGGHDRVPGGSCSGAAVCVAANLVDFSVGIDSVGGVRLPSGFCGIIGFRASHGVISHSGVIPVSTSLDTIGCFAKDPKVLRRVVHVMMKLQFATPRSPRKILIADDCFELLKIPVDRVVQPVIRSTEKLFGRQVIKHENLGTYLSSNVPSLLEFTALKTNDQVKTSTLSLVAQVVQFFLRYEFKQNHGEWINSVKPDIDTSIKSLILEGDVIDESEIEKMNRIRNEMRLALNSLLKDDGVLVIPTFADPPPKVSGKEMSSETFLHGGDRFLLDTVQTMYSNLQEQVEVLSNTKSSSNTYSRERSAEFAKEKGNQAFKDKQWQKAISFYTEAIKLYGSNATYYSNRAAAYLELGSFVQAEADCTKAINLDKKNVKAYLRRGTAREMLGYYKEATEDFRHALVLEPTNKRAAVSVERLKTLFQ